MKKQLLIIIFTFLFCRLYAQNLSGPNGYKVVDLGNNGQGDYTHSLILLHEVYNGSLLGFNNVVGTLTASRGSAASFDRISIATINTSSAYNGTIGAVHSLSSDAPWKLKTCNYNGKKYLALDVPYTDAYHDNGYKFAGWSNSTGESLRCVNYTVGGQPVNQAILTNIEDFTSNMTENIEAAQTNFSGGVSIGAAPDAVARATGAGYKLAVAGGIITEKVTVKLNSAWPDYVFKPSYKPPSLITIQSFISKNGHLPELPSEQQVKKNGLDLGEMNRILTKKVEELTLYLIEKDKKDRQKDFLLSNLQRQINRFKKSK